MDQVTVDNVQIAIACLATPLLVAVFLRKKPSLGITCVIFALMVIHLILEIAA